jgi:lactoylglutathione lyase
VADLARAEAWYQKAFGLQREFATRVGAVDLEIVMLRSEDGGYRVELLHRPGSGPGLRAANPAEAALPEGFGYLAFGVPDLCATHSRLLALGAREIMPPQPSPEPGVRMSFLADPEGNLVELVERERSA